MQISVVRQDNFTYDMQINNWKLYYTKNQYNLCNFQLHWVKKLLWYYKQKSWTINATSFIFQHLHTMSHPSKCSKVKFIRKCFIWPSMTKEMDTGMFRLSMMQNTPEYNWGSLVMKTLDSATWHIWHTWA